MMKTLLNCILLAILVLTQPAHALTVKISPELIDIEEMNSFDIMIEGGSDICGFEITMNYDPSVITIPAENGVVTTDFLTTTGNILWDWGDKPNIIVDNTNGELKFTDFTLPGNEGPSGPGILANINFSLESQEDTTISFDTDWSSIVNTKGEALPMASEDWIGAEITCTSKITAGSESGGSISPSGDLVLRCGTAQTFIITPDPCYDIKDVKVSGTSVGTVTSYTFTDLSGDHSISASFVSKPPYAIEINAGDGGTISPAGPVLVSCGASQTFAITPESTPPDRCYHIADVKADGVSKGSVNSFTFSHVSGDHTISASFERNDHTITASAGVGGSISPSGSVPVPCSTQGFTITPDDGWHTENVLTDGDSQGPVNTYSFENVSEDHTISVIFAQNPPVTHTLTPRAGDGGTIDPSEPFEIASGSDKSFTMTPDDCYQIADVIVSEISVMDDVRIIVSESSVMDDVWIKEDLTGSYTFKSVDNDYEIEAVFEKITHPINIIANGEGSVTPSQVEVECGSDQTFEITADDCHEIKDVIIDGESVGVVSSYTFEDVRSDDHSIEAEFGKITYTITATSEGRGGIRPPGEVTVECGEDQTFEFIPEEGSQVAEVRVNGAGPQPKTGYTFQNVTADSNRIHVIFDPHLISVSAGDNGTVEPSGDVSVARGEDQIFTITPGPCYRIADVRADNRSVTELLETDDASGDISYKLKEVDKDHVIEVTFYPTVIGDINGNENADLADVILGLKVICGVDIEEDITLCSDSDGKIGMSEVIHILRTLSDISDTESE
ncbi:cohesin domain-containing protein [Desulfobacterales bacterium HSG2]|nr:cohesin domain-containing protein [Desulfobacterales bacterium HSG2]